MVRRGFKFLSDEIAPISRSDGLVYPFPRALNLRPGTLALLGLNPLQTNDTPPRSLTAFDIETLMPAALGEASPLSQIVILQPDRAPEKQTNSHPAEFGLLLDRVDEGIFSFAKGLDEVERAEWNDVFGFPLLMLRSDKRRQVISILEGECAERGILVLDIHKRPLARPTFEGPARLQSISKTQAVMELLRQFQPGHESVLLREEFGGSPRRLFLELADLIKDASCFYLSPGPLAQMADLVEEQVRGG